jgi:hypothetical protein
LQVVIYLIAMVSGKIIYACLSGVLPEAKGKQWQGRVHERIDERKRG